MPENQVFKRVAILLSVAVVLLFVGLGLWYFFFDQPEEQQTVVDDDPDAPSLQQPSFTGGGTSQNGAPVESSQRYVDYQPGMLDSLEEGQQAVLFFKADWCSTCNGLDENIEQNINQIPEGYYIIKVDFDNDLDLVSQYEAYVQHTLVLVNSNGEMVRKWVGSPTLEAVLGQAVPAYEDESGLVDALNNQ